MVIGETPFIARNHLKEERIKAGFATPETFAKAAGVEPDHYVAMEAGQLIPLKDQFLAIKHALGDIPDDRLYLVDMLQLIGVANYGGGGPITTAPEMMRSVAQAKMLFVAKDELTWSEKRDKPAEPVDVFLSMSCGPQATPHLLLDTVAVAKALGIKFQAAAGPAGCCGKPFRGFGQEAAGEAFSRSKAEYAHDIGAKTTVVWCTACQQTAVTAANRRSIVEGTVHPVREMQILRFLEQTIREMGDRVPWKTRVNRKVLVEGHDEWSPTHSDAFHANADLLRLVPGVTVVGMFDGSTDDVSPCAGSSRPAWRGPLKRDKTMDDVRAHRVALADMASARGADTVACQHQGCHQTWGRYASDRMALRHAVSIVAEALGVAHPDRAQAAARLGDPKAVLEQTRPIWTTWDITEDEAFALANGPLTSDPAFSALDPGATFIPVDVLAGKAPGLTHQHH